MDALCKEARNAMVRPYNFLIINRAAERLRVHQSSVRLIISYRIPSVLVYVIGVLDREAPCVSVLTIFGQDYYLLVTCLGPWMAATSSSCLPVKDRLQLGSSPRAEHREFGRKALVKAFTFTSFRRFGIFDSRI